MLVWLKIKPDRFLFKITKKSILRSGNGLIKRINIKNDDIFDIFVDISTIYCKKTKFYRELLCIDAAGVRETII